MSALSNRAKYRARHGLEISLRLSLPDRLSFHAAGGLLDRGYAGLGCTSVSRMPRPPDWISPVFAAWKEYYK